MSVLPQKVSPLDQKAKKRHKKDGSGAKNQLISSTASLQISCEDRERNRCQVFIQSSDICLSLFLTKEQQRTVRGIEKGQGSGGVCKQQVVNITIFAT